MIGILLSGASSLETFGGLPTQIIEVLRYCTCAFKQLASSERVKADPFALEIIILYREVQYYV